MSDPRVSICIPTYHGAPWLADCLRSALDQTLSDVEVLVVDDASSDDTAAVARAFAAADDRVKVHVNRERLGLARNWNRAVELAQGEWVKFLFQDDTLAPTCVERMAAMDDAAMVVCDRTLSFDAGVRSEVREYFDRLPAMDDLFGPVQRVPPHAVQRALADHLGVNFFGEPPAVMLRREVLQRFGGFNTDMIQLCDLEYWARVGSAEGFARIRDELATFRIHGLSASAQNTASQHFRKDVLDTLILLHEYAFDQKFAMLRHGAAPINFSALAYRELTRARREVGAEGDPSLRDALATVLEAYPKLSSPLWRMWHKIRKQLPSTT